MSEDVKMPEYVWLSYYEDPEQLRECVGKSGAQPPDDDTLYRRDDLYTALLAERDALKRGLEGLRLRINAVSLDHADCNCSGLDDLVDYAAIQGDS